MKNLQIASILYNIADILELQGVQFKPRAYRNAAKAIESLPEDIEEIYKKGRLEGVPGVGKSIAEKVEEIIKTGKLKYYQKLKKKVKIDIEELKRIPGLGPKKIKFLYQKLKIKNVKDLEKAVKKGKLQKLERFGEKTEESLLQGIEFVKGSPKRFLYAHLIPIVEEVKAKLGSYPFIKKIEVAGSFRRGKETIGDLDFVVVSNRPEKVRLVFAHLPDVKKVLAGGRTKSSIRLSNGLQIDLRVVGEKRWGSAMNYFIGSKAHNIELRKFALSKGFTLSEYGLFKKVGKKKKWTAGQTEEEIYKRLGMQYIEPELRENRGEIALALTKKLPSLVMNKDIKGVFHNHSTWSDGANSLLEMAASAEKMKFRFISFNDHYGDISVANPLTEKKLPNYLKEIDKIRKKVGIRVFSGLEVDILKDGALALGGKKLKQFDVVIGAVHSSIRMGEKEMTKRVCTAIESGMINILAHPTDRLLNLRKGLNLNLKRVFNSAKMNNVFLEICSSPKRMDLSGENVKAALDTGCKFTIGADAHDIGSLGNYKFGVNLARRGWLEKKDLLNCWSLKRIDKILD